MFLCIKMIKQSETRHMDTDNWLVNQGIAFVLEIYFYKTIMSNYVNT